MRAFRGPNPCDLDDEEYVDPDLIEAVFLPPNPGFDEDDIAIDDVHIENEIIIDPDEINEDDNQQASANSSSTGSDYHTEEDSDPDEIVNLGISARIRVVTRGLRSVSDSSSSNSDNDNDVEVYVSSSPDSSDSEEANGALSQDAELQPVPLSTPSSTQTSEQKPAQNTEKVQGLNTKDGNGSGSSSSSSPFTSCDEEEEVTYSNPIVSAEQALAGEAIRGDRIGNTTYSERHVLKILMRWIQELPKYSETDTNSKSSDGEPVIKMERDFKKEMELLWDMSSESDVAKYLTEKDIFRILRDSLPVCTCDRFLEIILGIFANILSESDILNTFPEADKEFELIDMVIGISCSTTHVPTLLQCFAVLRRLAWYMSNVKRIEKWLTPVPDTKCFTSDELVSAITFMLKGSTNVMLLNELVVLVFTLLETLIGNEQDASSDGKYKVFTTQSFVAAILEGLNELVKNNKQDEPNDKEAGVPVSVVEDAPMPQHFQIAIQSGLGALCFMQKVPEGQEAIRAEKLTTVMFLIEFFKIFHLTTQSLENEKALEYFIGGLNLLTFCHTELQVLQPKAVMYPVEAAQKFIKVEETKSTTEKDKSRLSDEYPPLINSISILTHEYLNELEEKFGEDSVKQALRMNGDHHDTRGIIEYIRKVTENYRLKQNKYRDKDKSTEESECIQN